jgi:hypothetical protein
MTASPAVKIAVVRGHLVAMLTTEDRPALPGWCPTWRRFHLGNRERPPHPDNVWDSGRRNSDGGRHRHPRRREERLDRGWYYAEEPVTSRETT